MTQPEVPARLARGVGDIAVTPHELASQAALDVMGRGGNAVDGAIAANAVLGVVKPTTCGPGGDLFALIHRPEDDTPLCLNASGRAGSGASADELRDAGHDRVPLAGPWGITVPGCVDGWGALLERCGTMPLGEVLQPAIAASAGFPASDELSAALTRVESLIADQESAPPLYPAGSPPAPGHRLTRPDLAATLRELADGGREAFYLGAPGRAISAATGHRIDADDLAENQAEWVAPVAASVFGRTGWTVPPNSQGYLVLAGAMLAELMEPPQDPADPAYHHALIEAYRAVAWERDDLVSDPRFAPLPADELVSQRRLHPRTSRLAAESTARWPAPSDGGGGTAYMCTADRNGLGVSLIQSNFTGIGSGLSAGSTGVFLHNRGAGFSLNAGHPNELAPGKRPLHTLSPTLWTRSGRLEYLLGTRGGHQQPQLLIQMAAHLMHAQTPPAHAQALPRWTMNEFGPGSGSAVLVEPRMPGRVVAGLEARGHGVDVVDGRWQAGWGPISLIHIDGDGVRTGAADPRVSTATAAVR